ncbi:MAG: hypothetical protein CL608_17970 [Anaerolineaceae bacterium]|nr:hypothetical protein [Anaerolineaceae bacterium]
MNQIKQQLSHLVENRPFVVLALIIVGALLIQGTLAATKTTISHDETISYLSAIGRQGDFEQILRDNQYPANQWVPVREWKAWFAVAEPFSFRQIGLDLAESDIHPPLYFWTLHIWTWLFGVHAWTGPALNMVFQAVGALGLFALGRRMLKNNFEALAVVFIWLLSPASLTMVLEARQYTLFGICTIFFVWLVVVATDKASHPTWTHWLLLLLATAAGALTHYHFALVVFVAGPVFVLKLVRRDFRRVLWVGTAVLMGYVLSFILHPRFYQSIQELSRRQVLEAEFLSGQFEFFQRVYLVGKTFTGYWTVSGILQLALFCLFLASIIWVGMIFVRNRRLVQETIQTKNFTGYELGLFFVCLAGLSILLYLTYVSPIHAMTERHMSAVWPFYPFLAIFLLRLVGQAKRNRLTILVGTAVLLSGFFMVWQMGTAVDEPAWDDVVYSDSRERFVVDGVYQGILPRIFFQLPDDALIYVAAQNELLAQPEAWLPALDTNSVYISELSYDNTEDNRDKIVALIAQQFQVTTRPVDNWTIGQPYFIEPVNE